MTSVVSPVSWNEIWRDKSLILLTDRAFVCVVGVIPRIDVESVSFVWDLPLDISLVDEILPQLARTVATSVSTLSFSTAYRL